MEKEGSKSSCTCVVAIIRMVGHSCNAGAHTIEWMEEGRSAVRLPDAYYAPTIHSLSLSLSISLLPSLPLSLSLSLSLLGLLSLSRFIALSLCASLSLCINHGTIANPGSGVG